MLATSTGMTYTVASLSAEGQKLYAEQRKVLSDTRTRMLGQMIADELLALEGKAQNKLPDALLAAQRAKVPQPTAAEIQSVFEKNRTALGGRTLDEVRPQIVDYLKREAEQKLVDTFLDGLRSKYKVVFGKDVNAVGLGSQETIATVGGRAITAREFEDSIRPRMNDTEIHIFEDLKADLEGAVFSTLVAEDAKARNLDTGSFIATEITDKLREFTAEERAEVEGDLMRRLFTKYNVKILLTEPKPLVQNISVDDDPQLGDSAAPVTVVMFTDYQCSACAGTYPILKRVIGEYGTKVRFVVRDFPLESIHENAFQAALAANAARAQGKYVEFSELLYRNQDKLDKESLIRLASQLGLNVKQFELDFTDAKTAAEVRKDQADGRSYGVGGTPAIFINGVKVHRLSARGFRAALDRALKK